MIKFIHNISYNNSPYGLTTSLVVQEVFYLHFGSGSRLQSLLGFPNNLYEVSGIVLLD